MQKISTSDFKDYGSFYRRKDGTITFVTKGEETMFRTINVLGSSSQFERIEDEVIETLYMPAEENTSVRRLLDVASVHSVPIPIDTSGYKFFDKLGIQYTKAHRTTRSFPATEVCRALNIKEPKKKLPTENRLNLCDVKTRKIRTTELPVSNELYKGKPTINPQTFDEWMIVLVKAACFRTTNPDYLLLKSIFDLK